MRILIVSNSRSGRGRSPALVERICDHARRHGHDVRSMEVGAANGTLSRALRDADRLVVSGGDGTLHHALPAAIESGVPIYHVPAGTENLFAREFGMSANPIDVLDAIERGTQDRLDVGMAEGRPFLLMLSVGPDASIIHRIAHSGSHAAGHAAYVGPSIAEVLRPAIPRLTIRADGKEVVRGAPGVAIIANSRQYAMRLDPAAGADMRDGMLDVVFLPARSSLRVLGWVVSCRLRLIPDSDGAVLTRARSIEIETDAPAPCQADGEVFGTIRTLSIECRPGAVPTVVPRSARNGTSPGPLDGQSVRT